MTPPTSEPVLEELRWLRALAARLVRDPQRADDAVQDALLQGLERPPRDAGARRGWLATVLRNVLRQEGRAGARRTVRERTRATGADAPAAVDAAAELDLHRRLVERVHALDEPYRTVIVLRYLRELSPAEIARELGVPEKTVRTRIERALAALRARLGPERERWLALLALPNGASTGTALLPWILPMNLKLATAAAAVLLAGTAFLLQRSGAPEIERAPHAPEAEVLVTGTEPSGAIPVEPPTPLVAREAAATIPADAAPVAEAAPEIHGFVRGLDGRGIAGVEVVFERGTRGVYALVADGPRGTSAADGAFALPLAAEAGRLTVRSEELVCVAAPQLDGTPPLAPPLVVVAPVRTYAGIVVEPSGAPVAGAQVEITLAGSWLQSRDIGGTAVHLLLPFAETRTDERGRFRFERAGFVADALVHARKDPLGTASVALPAESHEGLELVIAPAPDAERTIHGVVLDAGGAPADGARVALGGNAVDCGADGSFVLAVERWRERGFLRAVKPGALPAELALADALARASSPERPIVLQLGSAPRTVGGRVLDADGSPVPGALVWTPDLTPFGSVVHVEGELAFSGETTVEALLTGYSGPWSSTGTTADDDGEFELAGLLDRAYAVFALDPRTFDAAGPVELLAGEDGVRIVLAREPRSAVAGRVVSRSGVPLAGVRVTPGRGFAWAADEGPNAAAWAGWHLRSPSAARSVAGATVETDADGRFAFPELVARGAYLSLRGGGLALGEYVALDERPDPTDLEIVVAAAARFRVVLARAGEADAFGLEDTAGELVPLYIEVSGATISAGEAELDGGSSGVVLVDEGEYVLVLRSGGEEVRRVPLVLTAGGLHEVRP
jgi:RNA polymerase sigma-70 factor (ECF subfamily)